MKNPAQSVSVMSDAGFTVLIGQLKRVGKITNALIQRGAVFAIYKSIVDRNSTPADVLFKALPAGMSKNSLKAYFEEYGNLAYVKATKSIVFFDVEDMTGKPVPEFDEDKLMADPWYKHAPEVDSTSAWDTSSELDKVLSRLEKAIKNETRPVDHAELIRRVRVTMAEYAREQDEEAE